MPRPITARSSPAASLLRCLACAAWLLGCREILGIDDRTLDAAGGGGGGGEGPTVVLPPEEQLAACAEIAAKDCEAWQRCAPDGFASQFADPAECASKGAIFWAAHLFGTDSGATLESAAQCGTDLEFPISSCDAWWSFNFGAGPAACSRTGSLQCEGQRLFTFGSGPASCFPRGSRGPSSLCGAGSQCDGGICFFAQHPGDPCGSCERAAEEAGDACPSGTSCAGDNSCNADVCVPVAGEFELCGSCLPHLLCFNGQCKARFEDGHDCDPSEVFGTGKCEPGHVCNPISETCEAPQPQPLEASCGALEDGGTANCKPPGACRLGAAVDQATCVPALALGEPCGTGYLFGGGCAFPGDCVAGFCQLRGPATCH